MSGVLDRVTEAYMAMACPTEASPALEPAARLVRLAPEFPELAADTILNPVLDGRLAAVVAQAADRLSQDLPGLAVPGRMAVCRTFMELAFNLVGIEADKVGLVEAEREEAFAEIQRTLERWQATTEVAPALQAAVAEVLQEMNKVLMGKSMSARMAESIEARLEPDNLAGSFLAAARAEIQGNVYYQICKRSMSKLGNDSATGLRRVRNMGYVQVSSNPVIAARAYEEFLELWDKFARIVAVNPHWAQDPERYADEIALHGTIVSLLSNLLIFRPLALLTDLHDGLVSYQLNPLKANTPEESLADAEQICSILSTILRRYDGWLGWAPQSLAGRPNIVFKVAVSSPAAVDMTVALNEKGIGTNNTVTYTVSQELRMLIAEAEGMARAIKNGILPVQVYQTNMEGRLEDHLREVEAERLAAELDDTGFTQLCEVLGPDLHGSREGITQQICRRKNLPSLTDERFVSLMVAARGEAIRDYLADLEDAIQQSGVSVTRRAYKLFFGPETRPKWHAYMKPEFGLSDEQAETVIDRIDMLPSSKRKADDTYLVLGMPNVTNTEFPDQQLRVWEAATQPGFELEGYRQSILADPDSERLQRALQLEDFRKAYEVSPSLHTILQQVGTEDGLGQGGMEPEEWPGFGPVVKTMTEFQGAYLAFRQEAVEFASTSAGQIRRRD